MTHDVPTPNASRRRFLSWGLGGLASVIARAHLDAGRALAAVTRRIAPRTFGGAAWNDVPYPLPLRTGQGTPPRFDPVDALVVPEGFVATPIAAWGDVIQTAGGPFVFGYNNDYTGLVPVPGEPDQFWLIVNHEYISSLPWIQGLRAGLRGRDAMALVDAEGRVGEFALASLEQEKLSAAAVAAKPRLVELCKLAFEDLGVSVLRVRQNDSGALEVVRSARDHFRVSTRSATHARVIAPTGPAAGGLGDARGTFGNCSGGTTPWGTFLTCEENYQHYVLEDVDDEGQPHGQRMLGLKRTHRGLPVELRGIGVVLPNGIDHHYGWVCEVDPAARTLRKHTHLGRFRHENVALRAEAGRELVAYMGDDRRGGHIWRFVSRHRIDDPRDKATGDLLGVGTLAVGRMRKISEREGKGEWIPLEPSTLLVTEDPGAHTVNRFVELPRRSTTEHAGRIKVGPKGEVGFEEWLRRVRAYAAVPETEPLRLKHLVAKKLRDERDATLGVAMTDAFLFANAVGGTPAARPEDLDLAPGGAILVAFTDHNPKAYGGADVRAFPMAADGVPETRDFGVVWRLDDGRPDETTFRWRTLVRSGVMARGGHGLAAPDNLAFDPDGGLWLTCDIETVRQNEAGGSIGVFGNNALFRVEEVAGDVGLRCFATGPVESELTGPTFTPDGRALVLSVQHPGEAHGRRDGRTEERTMTLPTASGGTVAQQRRVPIGSNYDPKRGSGATVPVPTLVAVHRKP